MTALNAPGRHYREGISQFEFHEMFPNDDAAETWFIETRWPDGVRCAHCGSDAITDKGNHPRMPYRCLDCRKFFSVKTNSLMHASKLGYKKWAYAIYQVTTNIKGISSLKLHRDLRITQKSAWHMIHRIRETWNDEVSGLVFSGPVEADETYIGGKEKNKHARKRLKRGRGAVGKTAVVGVKDRATNQVSARPVEKTDKATLQGFVHQHTKVDAKVYTDEAMAYVGIRRPHEAVRHSAGEYVRRQAHTNGLESFWALLKRGYVGIYHWFSVKHLHRYVTEFAGRHNWRDYGTMDQMAAMVTGFSGKRLRYVDLIAQPPTAQPSLV